MTAGMNIDAVRRYLAEKLGFYDPEEKEDKEKIKVLDNVSIEGIAEFLKSDKCKNVITMAGAGISTCKSISLHTHEFCKNP